MKINRLFFWGICLILFLPIIILPPTFQPSVWSRTILFRIILTVLISIFLFGFLYKKELSFSIPKIKNRIYIPFFILLAFFTTLILATIFSQDIGFSVFGSPSRAGGLLNLLFFFIFVVFLTIFTKENQWSRFFNLLFTTGVLASSLAIVQYFNILENIFISFEGGRTPSFLGNSTFLAIYMLFLAFLSFTFLIQKKGGKKKIIYAILFSLFIFTILITASRAAYLGLLVGFFYFFFFYPVRNFVSDDTNPKKLKTLKIIATSLLLIILFVVFLFNSFPQLSEKNSLFKIAVDRLSIKKVAMDLTGTRFAAWQITLEAIKDKPILGWGPENFYIGFEKHYDPTMSNLQRLWWDRPHNIFLDVAVSSGIISLLLYIAFWLALFWQLQIYKRKRCNSKNTYFAHGLQAMFIGYLSTLFFNFDSFPTYLISFFFIGYSFYLISEQSEKTIIYPPQSKIFQKKTIFIVFLLLVLLFLWFWNIKPLYLNEKMNIISNLVVSKNCKKALEMIDDENWGKAGVLKPYVALKYSDTIKKCVSLHPEKEVEYSKKALEYLKNGAILQPKFTRTWLLMGSFVNVLVAREKNQDNKNRLIEEARGYLNKALYLSPKRQEILVEMEKNYLLTKDYHAMKTIAEDCIKIDDSRRECYWYLGIAEIFMGNQEVGKKHIEESMTKWGSAPAYIQLGAAYLSQNNYIEASEAYRYLVADYPDNASYHAVAALLYKKVGNYKMATLEAVRVFQLQPDNPEALKFLEGLLSLNYNDIELHTSLAYIYREMGEEEKARREILIVKSFYLQLIAKHPKNSDYHLYLAGVYGELKEYEKAYQEALLTLKLNIETKDEVEGFIHSLPGDYWQNYFKSTERK